MPNYFVPSVLDADLNDQEIIDFINKKGVIMGHKVEAIFRDASNYPTSVLCTCKKYHRMLQGMPDWGSSCDKRKIRVPSVIYDVN